MGSLIRKEDAKWQNRNALILGWTKSNNCGKVNYVRSLKEETSLLGLISH